MTEIVNAIALVAVVVCVVISWNIYRLTRAWSVLFLVAAHAWATMVRVGITFKIDCIDHNTRPLTLVTFLLFAVGLGMLLRVLRHMYRNGK